MTQGKVIDLSQHLKSAHDQIKEDSKGQPKGLLLKFEATGGPDIVHKARGSAPVPTEVKTAPERPDERPLAPVIQFRQTRRRRRFPTDSVQLAEILFDQIFAIADDAPLDPKCG